MWGTSVREELLRALGEIRDLSNRVSSLASRFPLDQDEVLCVVDSEEDLNLQYAPPKEYFQFRIVEDGPIALPASLLSSTVHKFPNYVDVPEDRIYRAWSIGHWIWAATATHTRYVPEETITGELPSYFLVVRGKGLLAPVLAETQTEASAALDYHDEDTIIVTFKFLVEVQICCAGIPIRVPPCLRSQRMW